MPQTCQAYYFQVHSSSGNLLCHMDFEVNILYDVCHNLGRRTLLGMISQRGGLLARVSQHIGLLELGFPSCLLRIIDIFPSCKTATFYAGVEHCGRVRSSTLLTLKCRSVNQRLPASPISVFLDLL